jgi:hypothetical protein
MGYPRPKGFYVVGWGGAHSLPRAPTLRVIPSCWLFNWGLVIYGAPPLPTGWVLRSGYGVPSVWLSIYGGAPPARPEAPPVSPPLV